MPLIFDETTMMNDNIFKFEDRLHSQMNKYVQGGAILVSYFTQDENSSTVDRGLQDIEALTGKKAPLRYNEIKNFPLYGFKEANPENVEEINVNDIEVNGDCIIIPSTIQPKEMDFFIINHLKMPAVFEVTGVKYDSMKVDGFYQIQYRLHSTSHEVIQNIRRQVNTTYYTELNAIGSNQNPIIQEDDFVYRGKLERMMNGMIDSYRSLYYNTRHNCFLYRDQKTGIDLFDICGNEFMAKYSLMNPENSNQVISLSDKLNDPRISRYYNASPYRWLEMDARQDYVSKFPYLRMPGDGWPYSSFRMWGDRVDVIIPLSDHESGKNVTDSFFDAAQFHALLDPHLIPYSDYEKVIHAYVHKTDMTIHDIPLTVGDSLFALHDHIDSFFYVPMVLYIIRRILRTN